MEDESKIEHKKIRILNNKRLASLNEWIFHNVRTKDRFLLSFFLPYTEIN